MHFNCYELVSTEVIHSVCGFFASAMPVFKVWNLNRTEKKAVVATLSVAELKHKGKVFTCSGMCVCVCVGGGRVSTIEFLVYVE